MDQRLESSLKISNIQSLQETQQESTIKIRSIKDINNINNKSNQSGHSPNQQKCHIVISKQHPMQQQQPILTKQIIRKVPNTQGTKRPSLYASAATNGSPKMTKINIQQPMPESPLRPFLNFTLPPVLETYIKELEDQNKEMKKVLLECRKEVVSIQMRSQKLTNLINSTVAKCNTKRPVIRQSLSSPPNQVQINNIQQQQPQQPIAASPVVQKTFKILPKKSHNITAKGNIVCRVPIFPITRLGILKQLELDLSKKEFSEYVFQKLYTVNNKMDIDKPSLLLNNTLNSIIDPQLMGLFQYEESPESRDGSDCEYFKSLQRIRVLYGKLVNALSNTIFAKSVDMIALEKFVKNKISAHRCEYLANIDRQTSFKAISPAPTIKSERMDQDELNEEQMQTEGSL